MDGILIRPDGRKFLVRRHDSQWWGWEWAADPSRGTTHKWDKLPKGVVEAFNVDNPPRTVNYTPLLSPFT